MPKYIYKRSDSSNWWFEIKIPKDVQRKLGTDRDRRSTETDSQKKAQRQANKWAAEWWDKIEKARSPDWEVHKLDLAVQEDREAGLSYEEIYDIGLGVVQPEEGEALKIATKQTALLKDHLPAFLKWCEDKGNSVKTIDAKKKMVRQFASKFRTLEDISEPNVMRWTSEMGWSGATQKAMRSHTKDFLKYLSEEVLHKPFDPQILDRLVTKKVNSKPKRPIGGGEFREILAVSDREKQDALLLLAHTGRRSIAISNLKCADLVVVEGVTCFSFKIDKERRPETHEPQVIPVHSKLLGIVKRLVEASKDGYLLPLKSKDIEGRSDDLRSLVKSDNLTSHQFRTSVITMLHNDPRGISEKAIYAAVGHSIGKDSHTKHYIAGLKPSLIQPAVEAIDWDNWVWSQG